MMNQLLMSVLSQRKSVTEPIENYVRFVSGSSRTITPKYTNRGVTLQYSVDSGATWTTIANGSATTSATEHWFRGQATGTKSLFTSNNTSNRWAFSDSSDLEVYGNLNFLLCDTLGGKVAPTSLGNFCYPYMFYNCSSLITAPSLPATTLAYSCYQSMFRSCSSLITAPSLPATTLAHYCYASMFRSCSSLITASSLPATTLTDGCYESMFEGCTALTTAPSLPATTLSNYCYSNMFNGCSLIKLSKTQDSTYTTTYRIPTSGTGTMGTSSLDYMFASTGGSFTGTPSINTTYYTKNILV